MPGPGRRDGDPVGITDVMMTGAMWDGATIVLGTADVYDTRVLGCLRPLRRCSAA